MATNSNIQYLDITVNSEAVETEIWPVLKKLRPQWTDENKCTQVFSKGVINSLVCFYQKTDPKRDDAIVVRVNGDALGEMGVSDRDREFLCLQVAQAAGVFPALYATFNNGMIYKFAPGRVLNYQDFRNPSVIKEITRKLYRFHHTDVDHLPLVNRHGKPTTFPKDKSRTDGFAYIDDCLKSMPAKLSDPEKDVEYQKLRDELTTDFLQKELAALKKIFMEIGSAVVLSHGDFHMFNMIYDEGRESVSFIDFELTVFKYESRDLVTVFGFHPFILMAKMIKETDLDLDEEHRLLWLRSYLEAMYESSGKKTSDIPEAHLEFLDLEHRMMQTAYMLELAIFFLVFAAMGARDDALDMVKLAKDKYLARKGELPDLKNRCLKLKSQFQSIKTKK